MVNMLIKYHHNIHIRNHDIIFIGVQRIYNLNQTIPYILKNTEKLAAYILYFSTAEVCRVKSDFTKSALSACSAKKLPWLVTP